MKVLLFIGALFALQLGTTLTSNSASAQGNCLETPRKSDCPPCLRKKGKAGASGGVQYCDANWTGSKRKK
jgi:hypothetical protein